MKVQIEKYFTSLVNLGGIGRCEAVPSWGCFSLPFSPGSSQLKYVPLCFSFLSLSFCGLLCHLLNMLWTIIFWGFQGDFATQPNRSPFPFNRNAMLPSTLLILTRSFPRWSRQPQHLPHAEYQSKPAWHHFLPSGAIPYWKKPVRVITMKYASQLNSCIRLPEADLNFMVSGIQLYLTVILNLVLLDCFYVLHQRQVRKTWMGTKGKRIFWCCSHGTFLLYILAGTPFFLTL